MPVREWECQSCMRRWITDLVGEVCPYAGCGGKVEAYGDADDADEVELPPPQVDQARCGSSRMLDSKGASLATLEEFDRANVDDIRTLASWLNAYAPDSPEAYRTRRILAHLDAARAEADEALRGVWANMAYRAENNEPASDCVLLALTSAGR